MAEIHLKLDLRKAQGVGKVALGVGLVLAAYWALTSAHGAWVRHEARELRKSGFSTLATRVIMDHPDAFTSSVEGCQLALDSVRAALEPRHLQFMIEKCMQARRISEEDYVYFMIAMKMLDKEYDSARDFARQAYGRLQDSPLIARELLKLLALRGPAEEELRFIKAALNKFPKDPEIARVVLMRLMKSGLKTDAQKIAEKVDQNIPQRDRELDALVRSALAGVGPAQPPTLGGLRPLDATSGGGGTPQPAPIGALNPAAVPAPQPAPGSLSASVSGAKVPADGLIETTTIEGDHILHSYKVPEQGPRPNQKKPGSGSQQLPVPNLPPPLRLTE